MRGRVNVSVGSQETRSGAARLPCLLPGLCFWKLPSLQPWTCPCKPRKQGFLGPKAAFCFKSPLLMVGPGFNMHKSGMNGTTLATPGRGVSFSSEGQGNKRLSSYSKCFLRLELHVIVRLFKLVCLPVSETESEVDLCCFLGPEDVLWAAGRLYEKVLASQSSLQLTWKMSRGSPAPASWSWGHNCINPA